MRLQIKDNGNEERGVRGEDPKPFVSLFCFLIVFFCLLTSPAHADCSNPAGTAGKVVYNTNYEGYQYCDGTNWIAMHPPGSGSGGCANPARPEGTIVYNPAYRVLQACAGNQWMGIGELGGSSASSWAQISAGADHSCAVKTNGTLWCWGKDDRGQLGNGAVTDNQNGPVQESTAATDWAQVSAGAEHSCAVKTDGTLWCWGWDINGELGNGTAGQQVSPMQETTGATDWAQVSASYRYTCAVKTDGTLWCWGGDANGQLGNGAVTGNQQSPVQESTAATDWAQVGAGSRHSCAVKTNGTLWCWGDDTDSQLGCGGCGNQQSPVQETTGVTDWGQVTGGHRHSCAVKTDSTLWCWGSDPYGQLGNGAVTGNQPSPVQESTAATDWAQVSASKLFASDHTCAVKTDGTLWCWGRNSSGQLGCGDCASTQVSPVQESTAATDWAQVGAGTEHSCAVKTDGTFRCWGDDTNGKLGNGVANGNQESPAQEMTNATNWAQPGLGQRHSCAIRTDNTLWCWGADQYGQLGNGAVTGDQVSPMQESTSASNWEQVNAGRNHSCAVKTDGTLWCWGRDAEGQLGNGAVTGDQVSPMQESTAASNWAQVSTSYDHTCAVRTDGTLWCWGLDTNGRLGCGGCGNQPSPVQESSAATNWAQVSVGDAHTCAVKTDNTLWCWGSDSQGQLGNGAVTGDQVSPVQEATSATNWAQVSVGDLHTCAVKTDNTLWCWGSDGNNGQLGNGAPTSNQPSPVQESTAATNWAQVSAGWRFTCAVKTSGTLWCWGLDNYGQVGNGATSENQQSPVQEATGGTDWAQVGAGESHACARKTNGTLWCWGRDDNGRLGTSAYLGYEAFVNSLCLDPERWGGTLLYHSSSNIMMYCDGVSWVAIGK